MTPLDELLSAGKGHDSPVSVVTAAVSRLTESCCLDQTRFPVAATQAFGTGPSSWGNQE
jgi:hypothetical protein